MKHALRAGGAAHFITSSEYNVVIKQLNTFLHACWPLNLCAPCNKSVLTSTYFLSTQTQPSTS